MNSIYDIYESILDDIETTMANGANDVIIDMLFSKDIYKRRKGFETLLSLVESHRPKQHKTISKLKSSDSYFVEFYWPIKIEDGELTNEILDYMSYIQVCKRIDLEYLTTTIDAADDRYATHNNFVYIFELSWHYTHQNFSSNAKNVKLYEVPEELNDLFRQIQMEAYNHK